MPQSSTDPDDPHRDLPEPDPSPSAPGWALLRDTLRPQWPDVVKGLAASLGWTFSKIAIPSVTRIVVDRGIVHNQRARCSPGRW